MVRRLGSGPWPLFSPGLVCHVAPRFHQETALLFQDFRRAERHVPCRCDATSLPVERLWRSALKLTSLSATELGKQPGETTLVAENRSWQSFVRALEQFPTHGAGNTTAPCRGI